MSDHNCNQGPLLEVLVESTQNIDRKLDKLTDIMTQVAVQEVKISTLEDRSAVNDKRLSRLEDQPRRFLFWILGSAATVALGLFGLWIRAKVGL